MREDSDMFYFIWKRCQEVNFRSLLRIQESQNCLEKENETLDELIGGESAPAQNFAQNLFQH